MSTTRITASELFASQQERLALRWLAGQERGDQRILEAVNTVARRPSLAGYLNAIYPNKVQILGTEELEWLDGLMRVSVGRPFTRSSTSPAGARHQQKPKLPGRPAQCRRRIRHASVAIAPARA